LLNASQFDFCERHSTTLQFMRLADHVTLILNNKMSMAAVFLDIDIEKQPKYVHIFLYNSIFYLMACFVNSSTKTAFPAFIYNSKKVQITLNIQL
jgi:hypothetical protein